MSRLKVSEAFPSLAATPVEGSPGRFLIQIATPGWGASGFYSPEVLEAAAKAKVFPAGTQMYLDHEMADGSGLDERGNRSVKDLAASFESDATWDGTRLTTVASVFGPYREALAQMAESIGLSMRAWADVSIGTAEGRTGTIVNELVEAQSVDFVTRAGRGGKILQVIESARADARAEFVESREAALTALQESRNVGQWIESRLHLKLTCIGDDMYGDGYLTREERIALSGAVGDALDAFTESLQVSAPQLYQRDLWDDPAVLAAQVEEAAPHNVPGHPAGRSINPREPIMGFIQVDEAEHRRVTEAAGRVQALESERDTATRERDEARTERDQLRESNARTARSTKARAIIEAQSANKVEFSALEVAGLTVNLPVTESGSLDEAAFTTEVDKVIATALESNGAGGVTGFGGSTKVVGDQTKLTESDYDKRRAGVFGRKVS